MDIADLLIRESIRDTMARYNHAGDGGKYDAIVGCFIPDGELQIVGSESARGHGALLEFFSHVVASKRSEDHGPPPALTVLRHCVTNVLITVESPQRATVASYFHVITDIGLDHWGRYRDVFVPQAGGDRWLIQNRSVKTDAYAPDSLFH